MLGRIIAVYMLHRKQLIPIITAWFYYEIKILNQCKKTVFLLNHHASGLGKYKMQYKKHVGWSSEGYVFTCVLGMDIFVYFTMGNIYCCKFRFLKLLQ